MNVVEALPDTQRIAGSFRDPSGYVFFLEGEPYRSLTAEGWGLMQEVLPQPWFRELLESGRVVPSRLLTEGESKRLLADHPEAAGFLHHERLPWISYPGEWCFSMLADAALCTLHLQERLAIEGLGLKDASAYNVQFRQGRPVFIDLGSIERPGRADLWFALGQFNRMFVFPLLLARHKGWDLRSYFLGALDGRNLEQVSRSFSALDRARPSLWLDLWLPLWLERRQTRASAHPAKPAAKPGSVQSQLLNLRRLRRKISRLASGYAAKSSWAAYGDIRNYSEAAGQAKREIIGRFLQESRSRQVLDLGCNTGEFSLLAAETGTRVISADADHDAVEVLYRRVRSKTLDLHPMVLDIANPSPGYGYCNTERASFLDRNRSDGVLALALIHHLHVSANLPLNAISALFSGLTTSHLILEFVPREDSMFQRLIRFRVDLYADYHLERCKRAFAEHFVLLREQAIPGSSRTLLLFRRRS